MGLCEQLNRISRRAGNKGMGKEKRGRMGKELPKPTLLLRQMAVYALDEKPFIRSQLLRLTLLFGSILSYKIIAAFEFVVHLRCA